MKSTGARFHEDVSTFLVIAPLLLTAILPAPRIIGIYHITATSIANPRVKAVGTVTVVAYYDTPICVPRDP